MHLTTMINTYTQRKLLRISKVYNTFLTTKVFKLSTKVNISVLLSFFVGLQVAGVSLKGVGQRSCGNEVHHI